MRLTSAIAAWFSVTLLMAGFLVASGFLSVDWIAGWPLWVRVTLGICGLIYCIGALIEPVSIAREFFSRRDRRPSHPDRKG
jgi:uncharacterized protein (DUF983 family)